MGNAPNLGDIKALSKVGKRHIFIEMAEIGWPSSGPFIGATLLSNRDAKLQSIQKLDQYMFIN
jgi:hypothetical protein